MTDLAQMPGIPEVPNYKNRSVRLTVFGIFGIIAGSLAVLMTVLIVLTGAITTATAQEGTKADYNNMFIAAIVYAIIAIWFVWMGIGSIKAKRWARALILTSSWIWLICGIGGMVAYAFLLPKMYSGKINSPDMPADAAKIMYPAMLAVLAVIYVVIPMIIIIFYSGKNVKATCERRNPKPCWTDKCPLPVLAICMMFFGWAASSPCGAIYNFAMPFFGKILVGRQGAIAYLVVSLLCLFTMCGAYRLRKWAWWLAVFVGILWPVSCVLTFSKIGILGFYEKMGLPQQQLDAIKATGMCDSPMLQVLMLGFTAVFMVFLLYASKFFKTDEKSIAE